MIKLFAWLCRNHLTTDKNQYYAQIKNNGSITLDVLANAIKQNGIELHRETIRDVLARAEEMKIKLMCEGYVLNTPTCKGGLKIKGNFTGPEDHFDAERHQVKAKLYAGEDFQKAIPSIRVEILGEAQTGILIEMVIDWESGREDGVLTPGNLLTLEGGYLKIAGDDAAVGVYLIPEEGAPIPLQLIQNQQTKLLLQLPVLAVGNYQLELATQYSLKHANTKDVRVYRYPKSLWVE